MTPPHQQLAPTATETTAENPWPVRLLSVREHVLAGATVEPTPGSQMVMQYTATS